MDRLEAGELTIAKVLSSDFDFQIPSYQRPYSWGADQALQLLDDLLGALENEENDPYFLGSIVLVKQNDKPVSEVIDGQQRLTTLTILLSVLRDTEKDPKFADALDAMVREPGNELAGLMPQPRLTLRSRDSEFFEEHIQTRGATRDLESVKIAPGLLQTDPQRLIIGNALALKAELSTHSAETIRSLQRLIHNQTYLVVVTTPTKESAFRIFNVMNARGMDLTPADIFKAKIIGAIESTDPSEAEEATTAWENAEEMLGREDFSDLFLHIRMVIAKERARRELLVEFEEQVLKAYLPDDGVKFMDDVLVPYANAHADIRDCSFSGGSHTIEINRWFRLLARIDNNDWRPPALWALKEHRDDPEWLDAYFRKLERLATSMTIRRQNNTQRTTRYGHLLRHLSEGKGLESPALDLDSREKAETLERLNGDVYGVRGLNKPLLLRLDELLTAGAGATYDHATISVEHVLPQNPPKSSQWCSDFSKSDRELWTHRLANLVLLSRRKNAKASNDNFEDKKTKYFTGKDGVSVFALTTQVLNTAAWTPATLEQRQTQLIDNLANEWDLR